MELTPVESSNLAAVGYDPETYILTVLFKNGRTYEYLGVTAKAHADLMAAESVGKYLNSLIKPTHVCRQIDG